MRLLALTLLLALPMALVSAEDAAPSALQKKLIGHWVADKDSHVHTYFTRRGRLFQNDHPDSDAALSMQDYQVWDEWPELHTIVLVLDDATRPPVVLAITFSEDGKFANVREKNTNGWAKAFKLRRMDDKTHPVTMPAKLKILDAEHGLGAP